MKEQCFKVFIISFVFFTVLSFFENIIFKNDYIGALADIVILIGVLVFNILVSIYET